MRAQPKVKTVDTRAGKRVSLAKDLYSLSGKEILGWIYEHDSPRKMVQQLPPVDLLWLVKKIGEDDCVPLLELASVDQWQYLLDLEIWTKDRLHVGQASLWLRLLYQADPARLVRWLLNEGEDFARYYFPSSIQVVVVEEDEVYDVPDGFFCLDRGLYIRAIDSEHQDTVESIIRAMAGEDLERCRALLLGLVSFLPTEIEEDMYRLRNVRLGEHGFLPFEDALSVYAPLDPERISDERPPKLIDISGEEEIRAMIPVSPLYFAGAKNMLTEAAAKITDPLFLDRIRLEFAGLCNQILSADGLPVHNVEVLMRACRRAARYLNMALEKLSGASISLAEQLLRSHPLVSIFRVGFGLALKLKWEAEQWVQSSWFFRQGLDTGFWGEQWGATLAGLMEERPRLYVEPQEGSGGKDFEFLPELDECRRLLRRLMALDRLLERVAELYPMDESLFQSTELTFHPLLFNLWGRRFLKLEQGVSGISLDQAKDLFRKLRAGSDKPPYQMLEFDKAFIEDLMSYAFHLESEAAAVLEDTLSSIWREFHEEYEWVSIGDLGERYSRFISIMPSPATPLQ